MKTRSVTGLGCLLVLLLAMACEPDDSARNTGKAGQLLAENRTWSRCNFVEGADCYYANPCTEWVDGDTVVGGHTWQRVYYAVDEACSDVRFRGLYRQDGQRLYRLESGKERLLFDFGKEVGEQVRLYASAEHYEVLTVDRIFDTVLPGGGGVPLKAMQIVDERGRVRDVWVENKGRCQPASTDLYSCQVFRYAAFCALRRMRSGFTGIQDSGRVSCKAR